MLPRSGSIRSVGSSASSCAFRRADAVPTRIPGRIAAAPQSASRGSSRSTYAPTDNPSGSLDVVPAIASLRARAEEIRESELRKAEGLLGRLDDGERRAVESITAQIVNKLLHLPTVRMKQAAVSADGVIYADAVRHLFGLGEEDER